MQARIIISRKKPDNVNFRKDYRGNIVVIGDVQDVTNIQVKELVVLVNPDIDRQTAISLLKSVVAKLENSSDEIFNFNEDENESDF